MDLSFSEMVEVLVGGFRNEIANYNGKLFTIDIDKDDIWKAYIDNIPSEYNQIYRTNRHYDCSCCKRFIRRMGRLVMINDVGERFSIWDVKTDSMWDNVFSHMQSLVHESEVARPFTQVDSMIGEASTFDIDNNKVWDHFYMSLVGLDHNIAYKLPDYINMYQSLAAKFPRFSTDAFTTLLGMFNEHGVRQAHLQDKVVDIFKEWELWHSLQGTLRSDDLLWALSTSKDPSIINSMRYVSSSIGAMLVWIAETPNVSRTQCKGYWNNTLFSVETYQRPTSTYTSSTVDKFSKFITDNGTQKFFSRRNATRSDIPIDVIMWANDNAERANVSKMDILRSGAKSTKNTKGKSKDVTYQEFVNRIIKGAESIELLYNNALRHNVMTMIAPVHEDSNIISWDNQLTWTYSGNYAAPLNVTKEVLEQGGKLSDLIRVSLMWNESNTNQDDLDLHCQEPNFHLYYRHKGITQPSSALLDVDNTDPGNKIAIENITYSNLARMDDGVYKFYVHRYSARRGKGFTVQVNVNGKTTTMTWDGTWNARREVPVVEITKKGTKLTPEFKLPPSTTPKGTHGLHDGQWYDVSDIIPSPNTWNGRTDERHYFFLLPNISMDTTTLYGFYNQMLTSEYRQYRQVTERLAPMSMTEEDSKSLHGIGVVEDSGVNLTFKVDGQLFDVQF